VDRGKGVISQVQAGLADRRDRVLLAGIVEPLHQRLVAHGLLLQDVVADTNYSNGVNDALLERRGITPWIPAFGKYKPEMAGFAYEAEADCFTCPAGQKRPFKRYDKNLDGGPVKLYRAATRDGRLCARKPTCAPKSTKRLLTRTAYGAYYRRALARQQRRPGQRRRRRRQRTVEPVVGSLLQHYGLRLVSTRGRSWGVVKQIGENLRLSRTAA